MVEIQVSFEMSLFEKRPVMTIHDSDFYSDSDDYFESHLFGNRLYDGERQ